MCRRFAIVFGFLAAAIPAGAEEAAESYKKKIEPLLERYCFDCHADGVHKGKFSMEDFKDVPALVSDRKHWLPMWQNVRSQLMPPSDEDQPNDAEKKELLAWIERDVFQLDPENPDPGRVTIRRLNRSEYKNAVYDLLGVTYDTTEVFPADDTGYGFDNIGDVLSISPLLMEKYINAADEVVELALPVGDTAQTPRIEMDGRDFKSSGNPETDPAWMAFASGRTVKLDQEIKWDGDYQVTVSYSIQGATEATTDEALLEISAGGKKVGKVSLGWDQRTEIELTGKVALKKGSQTFEISLTPGRRPLAEEEVLFLNIHRVTVQGPVGGDKFEYSKGYNMIFVDGPAPETVSGKDRYARKIMRSFVSRAFRQPLDDYTIDRLCTVARKVSTQPGKDFQDGIKQAIAICLCSPRFLFRAEFQPEPNNPDRIVPLDEYSLASRLSFFLWQSLPDDELLSLAFQHKLRENLKAQVDRMLADPRSGRMVRNFVGQWLETRDVDTVALSAKTILGVEDNREAAKEFDPRLRTDMRRETEMLFDFVLRKGRPAEELISARYSFLNERLANYYGIDGVEGDDFRPVDLTEHPERGGILTQGSFLLVTSNPTRTSAVKRGLFVLENLLGTPPPPPPAGIPKLEDANVAGNAHPTQRQMMEIHRKKPECRSCHARMDPIGIGLENFDALGRFRRLEHGQPIDSSGQLVTGEEFADVAALKALIGEKRQEDFYRCLTEKLLTFAIGRGVDIYDSTTIDQLVTRMGKNDGSMRELIQGIVESAPFQKRRGDN